MIIIGTTISLVLTISASVALELNERANDRRLSALMVMGTIEDFANGIEEQAPVIDEFYTPHLKPESLNTLGVYKKQLDSIKAHQSLE